MRPNRSVTVNHFLLRLYREFYFLVASSWCIPGTRVYCARPPHSWGPGPLGGLGRGWSLRSSTSDPGDWSRGAERETPTEGGPGEGAGRHEGGPEVGETREEKRGESVSWSGGGMREGERGVGDLGHVSSTSGFPQGTEPGRGEACLGGEGQSRAINHPLNPHPTQH